MFASALLCMQEGGHVIILSFLRPLLFKSLTVEYLVACDGALSCIQIMTSLNDKDFFLYRCLKKVASKNWQ